MSYASIPVGDEDEIQPSLLNHLNNVLEVSHAVPVKLAEFWQEESALWFTQAEVQSCSFVADTFWMAACRRTSSLPLSVTS